MAELSTHKPRTTSKWQQIYTLLREEILDGRHADKSEFFTLKELCHKYSISNITAQRIFKELKLNGLIATTGRRGTIVTNSHKTNRILLCLFKSKDPTSDPFRVGASYKFAEGFFTAREGTPFEVYPVSEDFLREHLDDIEDDVVMDAGILLNVQGGIAKFDKEQAELLRRKINPVIIHSFTGLEGFPQIGIDYYKGFHNAVSYLLRKGHANIAFMMGSKNIWHTPRLRGYIDALEDNGCIFDNELIQTLAAGDNENDWKTIRGLLKNKSVSAMVCSSDRMALRIHAVCKAHGVRIPEELALVGFDNIAEGKLIQPTLTTMDSHLEKFGEAAINLLERRRAGFDISREDIKLIPTLIERRTT